MNMLKDQNVRLAATFIAGVLVGMGILWLGTRDERVQRDILTSLDTNGIASSTDVELDNLASASAPSVRVEDQNPGKFVVVAQAVLDKPAWVAIHDNIDGKPGNVLGARLFDKGNNSGIIELLRSTVSGTKYIAVLHTYSGVKKPFDVKLDTPLKNVDDEIVMTVFEVNKARD